MERASRPGAGESRQKPDNPVVALQEHFGNAGGRPEIPVDLKQMWIAIKQIWSGALA
jgi:hypothetical protein